MRENPPYPSEIKGRGSPWPFSATPTEHNRQLTSRLSKPAACELTASFFLSCAGFLSWLATRGRRYVGGKLAMADTGMDVNYLGAFDEFDLDTGTIVDTEGRATRPRYVLTVWDIDAGGDEAHYTFWATATDLSKYRVRSGRGLPVPIWRSPENYQFYNYDPWDDLTRNPPRCIYDIQTWIAIGDFLRWVKRNYAPPESLSIWSMPMSADTDGGYYLLPLLKMPWGEKVAEEFYALRSPPSTYFWRHPPASSDRFDYKPPDWIASNGALFVYNDYDPWEHLAA